MSVLAYVLILAVGVLVGTVGMGGLLVVPILVFVEGAVSLGMSKCRTARTTRQLTWPGVGADENTFGR
ncbi:MAG: hypothetical protein ACREQZ_12160 [Woeseiaceae bacterium]